MHRLKKGDRVGYGDALLRRDTEIAVLAVGTADGAFTYRYRGLRACWQQRKRWVTINGTRVSVISPPGGCDGPWLPPRRRGGDPPRPGADQPKRPPPVYRGMKKAPRTAVRMAIRME